MLAIKASPEYCFERFSYMELSSIRNPTPCHSLAIFSNKKLKGDLLRAIMTTVGLGEDSKVAALVLGKLGKEGLE